MVITQMCYKVQYDISNPVFLIGTGRSGSSIVFEAFSKHSHFGWISNYYYFFKSFPQIGFVHRVFKNRIGKKPQNQNLSKLNQILPRPLEVYPLWGKLCGQEFRYSSLHLKIPDDSAIVRTKKYFAKLLRWQGKKRLCVKLTGPPRLFYLNKMFTNAFFIDIVRDPVYTVNSYLNVKFWNEKGTDKPHWNDFFNQEDYTEWDKYGRTRIALAALEWRRIIRLTQEEVKKCNANYLLVKYEDFLDNPKSVIKKMIDFVGLDIEDKINQYIDKTNYNNKNTNKNISLSDDDITTIKLICKKEIDFLGY